jgi:uncharacterized protein YukE
VTDLTATQGADMKFAMGSDVLSTLTKKTSTSSEDLGALVKQLAAAAEPLQGKFNGAGRAAFDKFKGETDRISVDLNAALAGVLGGIAGMDRSFGEGDQQMADETRSTEGGTAFDAARFGSTKA